MKSSLFSGSLLVLLALASLASAQDRVAAAIDSLPSIKHIDQVAISPDGSKVAYIVEGELSVEAVFDGVTHPIAPHQNAERAVTWAAASHHLAWLSDLPGGKPASPPSSSAAHGAQLVPR